MTMVMPRLTRSRLSLLLATSALALVLGSCATLPPADTARNLTSLADDTADGIEIASGGYQPTDATKPQPLTLNILGVPEDCAGPGFNVSTSSTTGDTNLLLDADGEPCSKATMLFDGRLALGRRAPDPAIRIGGAGQRWAGLLPDAPAETAGAALNPGEFPPLPAVKVASQPLGVAGTATLAPAAGPADQADTALTETAFALPTAQEEVPAQPPLPSQAVQTQSDNLSKLLASWQDQPAFSANTGNSGTDEASSSSARALDRAVSQRRTQQAEAEAARLLTQLREKERQLANEERLHASTRAQAQTQKDAAAANLASWQQEQEQYAAKLAATQEQAKLNLAAREKLAQDKTAREKQYQDQLATLKADLASAERAATKNRNELVLAAAQKIAEAENLANAARLAQADASAREAAQKKQEAEDAMARAVELENTKARFATLTSPTAPAEMSLLEVPVVIHLRDQTLPDILNQILAQAQPQAGTWQADWQLPPSAQPMLADKWSLTAEASVEQLLKNLTAQVKGAHGYTLRFTQFPQSRLVVVTMDGAGPTATPLALTPAPAPGT